MRQGDQKPDEGWGEDPLREVTKRFIKLAQIFFGVMEKGHFRWDPESDVSEIFVSDQKSVNQNLLTIRPAVLFHRSTIKTADLAIRNIQATDGQTAERTYSDLMPGVMTVNCIAREGVTATRLAWTLFHFIRRFNEYFIIGTPIHDMGKHMSVGSESEPGALVTGDSQPIATLVTLAVPYSFQDTWKFSTEGVKLDAIELAIAVTRQNLNSRSSDIMVEQDVIVTED